MGDIRRLQRQEEIPQLGVPFSGDQILDPLHHGLLLLFLFKHGCLLLSPELCPRGSPAARRRKQAAPLRPLRGGGKTAPAYRLRETKKPDRSVRRSRKLPLKTGTPRADPAAVQALASQGGEIALDVTFAFDNACSNPLMMSPSLRGSDPYPCGSLTYRTVCSFVRTLSSYYANFSPVSRRSGQSPENFTGTSDSPPADLTQGLLPRFSL